MTDKDDDVSWENATWEGNRRAQLRRSLKLTPKERFDALETMAETARLLANAGRSNQDEKNTDPGHRR